MALIEQPISKDTVPVASASASTLTLRRELGKWDLAAIGINQVIGSAVFILPSQVAARDRATRTRLPLLPHPFEVLVAGLFFSAIPIFGVAESRLGTKRGLLWTPLR
jgi:hypothetical protein